MAEVCNTDIGKKMVIGNMCVFVDDVDYVAFFDLSTAKYVTKAAMLLDNYEPELYVATLVFEHALAHPNNDMEDARIAVMMCYERFFETRAVADQGVRNTFALKNIVPYVGACEQHKMAIRAILNSTLLRGQTFPIIPADLDLGGSAHPHGNGIIFNLSGFMRQVSFDVGGVRVWGQRSESQTVFGATLKRRVAYLGIVNSGGPIAVAGGVGKARMTFNTPPSDMHAIIYVSM